MTKLQQFSFAISLLFFYSCAGTQDIPTEVPQLDWEELQKTRPWEATEYYEPVPPVVTPGTWTGAPSDATILFDGSGLESWKTPHFPYGVNMDQMKAMAAMTFNLDWDARTAAKWTSQDGQMIVVPGEGSIETKKAFGNAQLHIEWLAPVDSGKEGQGYSNSGIFLMGLYEVQILNNYKNPTYVNGQSSSIYKQHPPLANACRPPGEWQTYDIIFNAPTFDDKGKLTKAAFITVLHNGVLTQNHVKLLGPTCYIGAPYYVAHPAKLPISLQDHGNKTRFRNIWIREL